MNKLTKLEPKDTVVFNTSINNTGKLLCRTGVLKSKYNNLLHCILLSISEDFNNLSSNSQNTKLSYVYKKIKKNITHKKWKNDSRNNIDIFKDILLLEISSFIDCITNKNPPSKLYNKIVTDYQKKNIYETLFNILTINNITVISQDVLSKTNSIDTFSIKFVNYIIQYLEVKLQTLPELDSNTYNTFKDHLNLFLSTVIDRVSISVYNNFIESFHKTTSDYKLNIISEYLKHDIFILDNKQKNVKLRYINNNRKSIILLEISSNHYESIGRLHNKNRDIVRIFKNSDTIISSI